MSLHSLPRELHELIGSHLDSNSYQNLRFAGVRLSIIQTCTFPVYKNQPSSKNPKAFELLNPSHDGLLHLVVHNHKVQFRKMIRFTSIATLQNVFLSILKLEQLPRRTILGYCFYKSKLPPDFQENTPIQLFSALGHHKLVCRLLKYPSVDPSVNDHYAIREALKNGHVRVVIALMHHPNIGLEKKFVSLFQTSCERGHEIIIYHLLKLGFDPTSDHGVGFHLAVSNHRSNVVKLLLGDGRADPTQEQSKSLRLAVLQNDIEIVDLLKQDGRVDLHTQQEFCLRHACRMGYIEIVSKLVDWGCDPAARDGQSLQWAYESENWSVVRLLLKHPSFQPKWVMNLILDPVYDCPEEIIQMVLQFVDPSLDSQFAIRWGVEQNWAALVRVLLKDPRVDIHTAPSAGKSAYDLARLSDAPEIRDLFGL
jgi:ankyrin repeat protein